MAGQEGLEPPTCGFGDRRSTIRATGLYMSRPFFVSRFPFPVNNPPTRNRKPGTANLLTCFLVRRMSAAAIAKLLQFQPLRRGLFVLRRRVVPVFALGAFQRNDVSHCSPGLF